MPPWGNANTSSQVGQYCSIRSVRHGAAARVLLGSVNLTKRIGRTEMSLRKRLHLPHLLSGLPAHSCHHLMQQLSPHSIAESGAITQDSAAQRMQSSFRACLRTPVGRTRPQKGRPCAGSAGTVLSRSYLPWGGRQAGCVDGVTCATKNLNLHFSHWSAEHRSCCA